MTEAFVRDIEEFVAGEGVDLISFEKGQRKDDTTQAYLRKFKKNAGVLYVGKAQEKARIMRTRSSTRGSITARCAPDSRHLTRSGQCQPPRRQIHPRRRSLPQRLVRPAKTRGLKT